LSGTPIIGEIRALALSNHHGDCFTFRAIVENKDGKVYLENGYGDSYERSYTIEAGTVLESGMLYLPPNPVSRLDLVRVGKRVKVRVLDHTGALHSNQNTYDKDTISIGSTEEIRTMNEFAHVPVNKKLIGLAFTGRFVGNDYDGIGIRMALRDRWVSIIHLPSGKALSFDDDNRLVLKDRTEHDHRQHWYFNDGSIESRFIEGDGRLAVSFRISRDNHKELVVDKLHSIMEWKVELHYQYDRYVFESKLGYLNAGEDGKLGLSEKNDDLPGFKWGLVTVE
jgi:hypothetical protein